MEFMKYFGMIGNGIVLVGAIFSAISVISAGLGKPIIFAKKRKRQHEEDVVKDVIKEIYPELMKDQRECSEVIKNEISIIRELNEVQNEQIDHLRIQNLMVMRQKIEEIYYTYKDKKKIPFLVVENLDELYEQYKLNKGNHHIDSLYKRMKSWEVIDTEDFKRD